jgi:hypothetical protein
MDIFLRDPKEPSIGKSSRQREARQDHEDAGTLLKNEM